MTLHNVNGNFKIDGIEKSRSKGAKDKWPRKKKLNTKASLNSLWEKMSYQERQVALEQTGSNLGDADYNSLSAIGGSTADVLSDYIRNLPRNVAMEEEEVKDEENEEEVEKSKPLSLASSNKVAPRDSLGSKAPRPYSDMDEDDEEETEKSILKAPVKKSKPRIGKPYSQQLGRKTGKGAGHIVVKMKAYTIDKMPKDMKEGVLDKYRYINVDDGHWYKQDGLLDLNSEEMKKIGAKLPKNWSEGKYPKDKDGNNIGQYPAYTGLIKYDISAFELDNYPYIQFNNIEVKNMDMFMSYLEIPEEYREDTEISFYHSGESSEKINIDWVPKESPDFIEPEDFDDVRRDAVDIFRGKVSEALKILTNDYEELTSDKAVEDSLKVNEYLFDIRGNIINNLIEE